MTQTLATTTTGSASSHPPLMIVHGLFGSARNWGALARRIGFDREVISVDMRNHGDSFWHDDHSYKALAEDLRQVAERVGHVDMLAHSMGGKAAMVLALSHPELLHRLIIADIAPVAYAHSHADLVRALKRADLAGVTRRSEADTRLRAEIDDPELRAFLLQSLDMSGEAARWKLNLEALLANMDMLSGFPDMQGQFHGEALFLTGEASDYVQASSHGAIYGYFPNAKFETIAGAGHWLHAEKPREVEAAVRAFLS